MKAEVLSPEEPAMIKDVAGYAHKEAVRVEERREVSEGGEQKAEAIHITAKQQCCKACSIDITTAGVRGASWGLRIRLW